MWSRRSEWDIRPRWTHLGDCGEVALLAAVDLGPAGHGALDLVGVVGVLVGVEVLDVALEAALGTRGVVAVGAAVLEVNAHVLVKQVLTLP